MAKAINSVVNATIKLHDAFDMALDTIELKLNGIEVNIPYIQGDPGGGKTMMCRSKVHERHAGLLVYTPGLERVEKFGGIPDIYWEDAKVMRSSYSDDAHSDTSDETTKELFTKWSVPQMICEIREMAAATKTVNVKSEDGTVTQRIVPKFKYIVVLFDDWHLAPANIQQIGFELFTHHKLNGHQIPQNVQFVLAGNEKSTAGAKVQLSAIRNRCTLYRTVSDVKYWIDNYALQNLIHPAAVTFFSMADSASVFHEAESTSTQYASPRSWVSAFNKLSMMETSSKKYTEFNIRSAFYGDVGETAGAKFWTYYKIYRDIKADKIFDEEKYQFPEDHVTRFAFSGAIAHEFYNRCNSIIRDAKGCSEKSPKAMERNEKLKKTAAFFTTIINDFNTKGNKDLVYCAVAYILRKKGDKSRGLLDGDELLSHLIGHGSMTTQAVALLQNLNTKLQQAKKVAANES